MESLFSVTKEKASLMVDKKNNVLVAMDQMNVNKDQSFELSMGEFILYGM